MKLVPPLLPLACLARLLLRCLLFAKPGSVMGVDAAHAQQVRSLLKTAQRPDVAEVLGYPDNTRVREGSSLLVPALYVESSPPKSTGSLPRGNVLEEESLPDEDHAFFLNSSAEALLLQLGQH